MKRFRLRPLYTTWNRSEILLRGYELYRGQVHQVQCQFFVQALNINSGPDPTNLHLFV